MPPGMGAGFVYSDAGELAGPRKGKNMVSRFSVEPLFFAFKMFLQKYANKLLWQKRKKVKSPPSIINYRLIIIVKQQYNYYIILLLLYYIIIIIHYNYYQ